MKTKALFIIPILFALSLDTEAINPTRGILNQKALPGKFQLGFNYLRI